MKTNQVIPAILLILTVGLLSANAQPKERKFDNKEKSHPLMYLNLNEEQEAQAKTFFAEMQKQITPLKLDVKEKEIELEKLLIADQINEKAVFAKVDEISLIKAEIQKAHLKNKIQLRSILTDEQRILFDAKKGHDKKARKEERGKRQMPTKE